jgi:hypothetical protein
LAYFRVGFSVAAAARLQDRQRTAKIAIARVGQRL